MFDYDVVDETAQEQEKLRFPTIFWRNGKSEYEELGGLPFTGGLVFSEQEVEKAGIKDGALGKNWSWVSFKGDGGEKIKALYSKLAALVIIRYRVCWLRKTNGTTETRPMSMKYEKHNPDWRGFRKWIQAACFLKGHSGLVSVTAKGFAVDGDSKENSGIRGVLREHVSKIVSVANREAPEGKKLPPYAFWMAVQPGKHIEVGQQDKSEATLPVLYLPADVNRQYLENAYVGKENLIAFQKAYHDLEEWAHEWDGPSATSGYPELNSEEDPQQNRERARAALSGAGHSEPPPNWDEELDAPDASDIPF